MDSPVVARRGLLGSRKTLKQHIASQIQRFSGINLRWPSFPPELEERFDADTSERRSARLLLEGLAALCMFDLFLLWDHMVSAAQFDHALVLRLGVVTPLALAVWTMVARQARQAVREGSIAFVCSLAGLVHLYLESSRSAVDLAFAQFGILAVILFTNTSLRLRFPYALAATTAMLAGDFLFLSGDVLLRHEQKVLAVCLIVSTAAITVVSNYSTNREERLNYLFYLRGDVLARDLSRSHERLARIAETDALTGLANRHAFERKLKRLWKMAHAQGRALSLIVVDVDHFKRINDTYGHPYGDKVLRRIASLMTEALRHGGDFAARFGGEEFVILLPGTDQASAAVVGERLRKLVEVAGFPEVEGTERQAREMTATVSCGVATAYPASGKGQQELLIAADRALYEAKADGRNRVRCAA
jgi:diguanylate cyclase (GGDEF)-like protein